MNPPAYDVVTKSYKENESLVISIMPQEDRVSAGYDSLQNRQLVESMTSPIALRARPFEAGIILVDKPAGPSSFKIVQQIRQALDIKKVGHSGTLDPFASGLLVICAGRAATKLIPLLMDGEKEYEATLQLGLETDTQDPEGTVISKRPVPNLDITEVGRCLSGFTGTQMQSPPRFSALKHNGKPLYYYARRGIEIYKEPRQIKIMNIECIKLGFDTLSIRVVCGKGTYIRSLAADIGKALGCGAHLKNLRRVRTGPFKVNDSVPGEKLADLNEARFLLAQQFLTVEEIKKRVN